MAGLEGDRRGVGDGQQPGLLEKVTHILVSGYPNSGFSEDKAKVITSLLGIGATRTIIAAREEASTYKITTGDLLLAMLIPDPESQGIDPAQQILQERRITYSGFQAEIRQLNGRNLASQSVAGFTDSANKALLNAVKFRNKFTPGQPIGRLHILCGIFDKVQATTLTDMLRSKGIVISELKETALSCLKSPPPQG